jgi:hypothetical protein
MRELVQRIRRQTIWETDGTESSVALANANGLAFIVNGRVDGNAKGDAGTQIMSGLIGTVLHPHPTRALVVGLGTGSTAGWLAAVPSMDRVDVIELEPAILKVAERCAPVNQNALHNPKLHVAIGDARELILTTREKYDLIVSEPSNPYRAGVAGLFTREYYQSVDRRLQPGGMFFQWVQAYAIDDRTMQIFYRTLGSVFQNIESWQTSGGDILLMASHAPVHYDVATLRTRLAEEPFKSALLDAWQASGLEDFLGHYVGSGAVAESLEHLTSGPINTDDRTVIEFAFARSVNLTNGFQLPNLRAGAQGAQADRPQFVDGEVDWPRVEETRLSTYSSLSRAPQFQAILTAEQRNRATAFASYLDGDLPTALRQWRAQPEEPKTLSQIAMLAECLAAEGDDAALPYIEKLGGIFPLEAKAILAELLWREHRPQEAVETLEKFLYALREDPWPAREIIKRSLARTETIANSDRSKMATGLLYEALRAPFCVYINEPDRLGTLLALGIYLDGDHPGDYTLPAVEAFEPHVLWQHKFLEMRKACYAAVHNPRAEQARRDFDEFMKHEASTADVSTLTKEIEAHSAKKSRNEGSSQIPETDSRP